MMRQFYLFSTRDKKLIKCDESQNEYLTFMNEYLRIREKCIETPCFDFGELKGHIDSHIKRCNSDNKDIYSRNNSLRKILKSFLGAGGGIKRTSYDLLDEMQEYVEDCLINNQVEIKKSFFSNVIKIVNVKSHLGLSNVRIDDLDLCVRTYNCLRRAEINLLFDILNMPDEDCTNIKNITKRGLEEIKQIKNNPPLSEIIDSCTITICNKDYEFLADETSDLLTSKQIVYFIFAGTQPNVLHTNVSISESLALVLINMGYFFIDDIKVNQERIYAALKKNMPMIAEEFIDYISNSKFFIIEEGLLTENESEWFISHADKKIDYDDIFIKGYSGLLHEIRKTYSCYDEEQEELEDLVLDDFDLFDT